MAPLEAQRSARRAGTIRPDRVPLVGMFQDPSGDDCPQEIDAWYQPFTGHYALPDPVRLGRARIAMITWEPWQPNGGSVVDDVLDGRYDQYIATWSELLDRHGAPVLLRLAHEFNGSWYPWSGMPERHIALWQHVRKTFGPRGNVHWVWSPNVPLGNAWQYWPGNDQVDVIALDGYAWDAPYPWPRDIFGAAIAEARQRNKPVMIGETACPPHVRRRRWIEQLLKLPVDGVVWFNLDKERAWALSSSEWPRWCRSMRTPAIGQLAPLLA